MTNPSEPEIRSFKTAREFERWLNKNHSTHKGIWLRFFKKDSGVKAITYEEAINEALCYGWIDGQANKYDEQSWLQKFTRRRPKSVWAQRNKDRIRRLLKEGKMKPAGLQEVDQAKADGRWEKAYAPPSKMKIPDDFLKALAKNRKAKAFFDTLNKTNTFAIGWRLQTAKKEETRQKRMKNIIDMLARGETFH
ncbi:MAG TPA: YdeI/OmpD-associated family protein [Cyclobacteriaceae bacterium]|nr:YdeI/OmpD-associated family protein [Cyclobacteriaceae bacterium]